MLFDTRRSLVFESWKILIMTELVHMAKTAEATSNGKICGVQRLDGSIGTEDSIAFNKSLPLPCDQEDQRRGKSLAGVMEGPIPAVSHDLLKLLRRPRQIRSTKDGAKGVSQVLFHRKDLGQGLVPSPQGSQFQVDERSGKYSAGISRADIDFRSHNPTVDGEHQDVPPLETTAETSHFEHSEPKQVLGAEKLNTEPSELSNHEQQKTGSVPSLISALGNKYFVSEQAQIPKADVELWETRVREPLKEALRCMSAKTDDCEAYSVIEFYMAGKRKDRLKPTVIITCCSRARKKELKRIIDDLRWLKRLGVKPVIVVDDSFGYRQSFEVEARSLHRTTQSCGIQARILARDMSASRKPPAAFTIGGYVMVDEQVYGLTTAHGLFLVNGIRSESTNTRNTLNGVFDEADISDSDTTSDDSSISISTVANSTSAEFHTSGMAPLGAQPIKAATSENTGSIDVTAPGSPEIKFEKVGRVHDYALDDNNDPLASRNNNPFTTKRDQDWALISFDKCLCQLNVVNFPGDLNPIVILDIVSEDTQTAGPVWVLTGRGPTLGQLNPLTVPIQLGKSSFNVQQITMATKIGT